MRVAQVGRIFEGGKAEPMRGGVVADHANAYMREMLGDLHRPDRVVALRVRDDRGQLTIYRARA